MMKTTRAIVMILCLALLLGVSASSTTAECANCPGDPKTGDQPAHEHGFLCVLVCIEFPSHCLTSN
jgi:hypothetical protein